MAEEALALHVEGMIAEGEAIPEPSSLETVMAEPQSRDGVAILVTAPADAAKTVRINVALPQDVLDRIDRYAEGHGMSRSGFLVKAAKQAMTSKARLTSPVEDLKHELPRRRAACSGPAVFKRRGRSPSCTPRLVEADPLYV